MPQAQALFGELPSPFLQLPLAMDTREVDTSKLLNSRAVEKWPAGASGWIWEAWFLEEKVVK